MNVTECALCGLRFRSRNEWSWHVRQDHVRGPLRGRPEPTPAASSASQAP
jgi:uncharacterized C2H2 Zn-finger protein